MGEKYNYKRRHEYYLKNVEKERAYTKKWKAEHKDISSAFNKKYRNNYYQMITEIKDNPCIDCSKRFPPCVMDFDHVRGEKSFSLNSMRSKESMLEEIIKCDLVCANCHRIRTWKRNKSRKLSDAEIVA